MNDDDRCPGTNRDGEPCGHPAGWGTPNTTGACKFHGGAEGSGAPAGNGNAETHGLTADAEKWFDRHRDEVEDEIRLLVDSWVEQAPFGYDAHGNVRLLVECAIDELRMQQANEYIDDEGIVVRHFDGIADDGREIYEFKENPALRPKSRLKKDTMRVLKDLGILDDPDTQAADSLDTLAEALSGGAE